MSTLGRFWRGELRLGELFWVWGILGGGVVGLFLTLFALLLLAMEMPTWAALGLLALDVPVNLYLLVGVWRSAGRPEVGPDTRLTARVAISAWALLMCLV